MTINGWLQIAFYLAVLTALVVPLGRFMARVFEGERTFLSPVLRPVETVLYRVSGVDETREQGWLTYTVAMLLFNAAGFLAVYGLLRLQAFLPLNPADQSAVTPDLSFNTAVSFATNTNWQNYGGESTLSYLTQMVGLTTQNFVSAATGIALAVAHDPRLRARVGKDRRQFLGRSHPLHALHPAADLDCRRAVPGLAGRAAEPRRLCRCHHARRRQAGLVARPGRFADRDQAARHQWRRLLERQFVGSVTRTRRRSAISSRCCSSC